MQERGGVCIAESHTGMELGLRSGSGLGPWVEPVQWPIKGLEPVQGSLSHSLSLTKQRLRERESLQMTLSSPTRHSTSDVVAHGGAAASELQSSPI